MLADLKLVKLNLP